MGCQAEKIEKPEISIIVPVYNGEKYVRNCIDMLLAQEGDNFEIIIINDGSTDNTEQEVLSFLPNEKLVYFKQENQGVSAARNKGLDICRGDWIVFVDVDDEVLPGYIKNINKETKENPDVDIFIYARYMCRDPDYEKILVKSEDIFSTILGCDKIPDEKDYLLVSVWSKVFRREIVKNSNIYFNTQLSVHEDAMFMFHTLGLCKNVMLIHCGFYRYVQNDDSVVHSGGKESDKEGLRKFLEIFLDYKESAYTSEFWNSLGTERISNYILKNAAMNIGRVRRGTKEKPLRYRSKIIRQMIAQTFDALKQMQCFDMNVLVKNKLFRKLIFVSIFTPIYIICLDRKSR